MDKTWTLTATADTFTIVTGYDKIEVRFNDEDDYATVTVFKEGDIGQTYREHADDVISTALSDAGVFDHRD